MKNIVICEAGLGDKSETVLNIIIGIKKCPLANFTIISREQYRMILGTFIISLSESITNFKHG